MSIKLKLVILFIIIKVLPLILISYLSIQGIVTLNEHFISNVERLHLKNEEVIKNTAYSSINDSIKALDEKSQDNIERMTVDIAKEVANFLYERDKDILFLSTLELNQEVINNFYNLKQKAISLTPDYIYNDDDQQWIPKTKTPPHKINTKSDIDENERNFRHKPPQYLLTQTIPMYKEVSFFNTKGLEIYKKSTISSEKKDISQQHNTYINAETYFSKITQLKQGEIFVSEVIGGYIPSKIIGTFSKEKTQISGIPFEPEKHAYAGIENPLGKKYDGIIRFITPVFKNSTKIGYLSLALDHRHIMEYTDTVNPTQVNQFDISDGSLGNYAFMWDYLGRNISHPRDYFITGFDKKTGKRVPGWISQSLANEFKASQKEDLGEFLKTYPIFYRQSLKQKPNLPQLKEKGEIGLDCRYLNFAPQCQGWMQLTQNGGYGSFVIFWSNVWKLTTAATIPYYTGQYANSKRGFGFITIGANVEEFHKAANTTRESIDKVVTKEANEMNALLKTNKEDMKATIQKLIEELSIYTFIMIILVLVLAFWLSNYISDKIMKLIIGTKEFANNNLKYRISVTSKDEMGQLESSFNAMANRLEENAEHIDEQHNLMAQQSKMAAMGEMLENIAHQWRQPLSMISSSASAIQLQKEVGTYSEQDLSSDMDKIINSTNYLTNTINDFRNFFKPDREKNTFNIKSLISKTVTLVDSKTKHQNITIIQDIQEDMLISFENELMHVLLNIINNANDAFNTIEEKNKLLIIHGHNKKDHYLISIQDNAGGIPQEFLSRIFEPYFTTKHQSQGTGIGLYMSKIMIEKHMQGKISVTNQKFTYENNEYIGANFIIKLPI